MSQSFHLQMATSFLICWDERLHADQDEEMGLSDCHYHHVKRGNIASNGRNPQLSFVLAPINNSEGEI